MTREVWTVEVAASYPEWPPLTAILSLWFTASLCVALCLISLNHPCTDK